MMIRRLAVTHAVILPLLSLFALQHVQAAEQFPYQAIVVGEQAEVRCGPGSRFYVTSLIKANEQVTVHRHDHGGWYMISPPPGSFSWIDAALVNPIGSNRGLVSIDPANGQSARAIVRIGSQLGDDHAFFGRELSHGDEVTILGEKVLAGPSGGTRMLKIVPPAQEFRWIKGEFLVPMSRQIQQQLAVDPYQVPAEHRHRHAMLLPTDPVRAPEPAIPIANDIPEMAVTSVDVEAERKTAGLSVPADRVPALTVSTSAGLPDENTPALVSPPPASRNQRDFSKLDEIDRDYAEMMARDPSEWDLTEIVKAYEALQKTANPHVSHLVAQRMEVVSRRQEIARHYQKFVQVSAETSRRDAQLLAQRAEFQTEKLAAPAMFQPAIEGEMQLPGAESSFIEPSQVDALDSAPAPAGVMPQLNGAGILQRMQAPPGFPSYVLVAPDGRMLAYVEPGQGVSLEPWVGKSAGLIGRRSHEANFGADVIRAQKIVPVQLAP